MILASAVFDQHWLAAERDRDAVVQHYRTFFALLDWTQISERAIEHPWPGTVPARCPCCRPCWNRYDAGGAALVRREEPGIP